MNGRMRVYVYKIRIILYDKTEWFRLDSHLPEAGFGKESETNRAICNMEALRKK